MNVRANFQSLVSVSLIDIVSVYLLAMGKLLTISHDLPHTRRLTSKSKVVCENHLVTLDG